MSDPAPSPASAVAKPGWLSRLGMPQRVGLGLGLLAFWADAFRGAVLGWSALSGLGALAAVLGALAGWWGFSGIKPRTGFIIGAVVLAIAAFLGLIGALLLTMPVAGLGLGVHARWGFAEPQRGAWYGLAVGGTVWLLLAWGALAAAAGRAFLPSLLLGLGTLVAGGVLRLAAGAMTGEPSALAALGLGGRLMHWAGIALPYMALACAMMARSP